MLVDADYMDRALALAERGRGRTSPNPMVGALVVSPGGVIVGQGFHERAGEPHAEIHALAAAGARARGGTLYCTLEPCCHTGRTGPCVERVIAAGIARIVSATEDPNPLVCRRGFEYLRSHGVTVEVGLRRLEAERLNRSFFTFMRERRPHLVLKVATSLDGRIAGPDRARVQLTSAAAARAAHTLRAEVDAIGIGSGTVLADNPLLTAREVYRVRPLSRVIFDRRLRTPPSARVFSTEQAGPVIILTTGDSLARFPAAARALLDCGARLEPTGRGDLAEALSRLGALGITSLLLEGGAEIHAAAWRANLVDEVQVYVAPVVLGEKAAPWLDAGTLSLAGLADVRTRVLGPDILVEGHVHRPH